MMTPMLRRIRIATAIAMLLPGAAFAAENQQVLLAQIAALQQQIVSLQKQTTSSAATNSLKNADTFAVSTTAQAPRVCNAPTHSLSQGDESDEVANVQIFLARMPGMYPEAKVTGYYGPATTRAVQRFQAKYGILGKGSPKATGWGYIGQKTLILLRQVWGCGGSTNSGWFSASPSHGSAPLSVVFSAQASSTRPLGASFTVDFGDGSKSSMNVSSTVCNSIAGPCSSVVSIGHRYTKSGSYTAILTMERVTNSCIAYPQSCPESATGFCTTLAPVCTSEKTSTEIGKKTVAVGTVSTVVSSVPATLKVTNPKSGSSAQQGSPLSIDWSSTNAPAGSTIALSLVRVSSNANMGLLASNKGPNGSYLWTVPRPAGSSGCTGSSVDCIGEIGGGQCVGSVCDVEPAVYRIRAELLLSGSSVVQAQSAAFAIGSVGVSELSSLSSSTLSAIDGWQGSINTSILGNIDTNTNTNTTGAMCQYSGVSYADGISLYTTCEDAYRYSCANVAGKHLTCKRGQWIDDANGQVVSLSGITTDPGNGEGGCTAPWNSTKIGNGQQVPFEPYFTNGVFTGKTPILLMQCSSGSWMKCSAIGDACQAYNPSL